METNGQMNPIHVMSPSGKIDTAKNGPLATDSNGNLLDRGIQTGNNSISGDTASGSVDGDGGKKGDKGGNANGPNNLKSNNKPNKGANPPGPPKSGAGGAGSPGSGDSNNTVPTLGPTENEKSKQKAGKQDSIGSGKMKHTAVVHEDDDEKDKHANKSHATGGKGALATALGQAANTGTDGEEDEEDEEIGILSKISFMFCWFIFTVVLGLAIGLTTTVFHKLQVELEAWWKQTVKDSAGGEFGFGFHLIRAVGVIISALVCAFIVLTRFPECAGGGAIPVKACVVLGSDVPAKVGIARFFLTAFYLGFGNPLGVESPTLHICAAVACTLYRAARYVKPDNFPPGNVSTMVVVGCTCGLSAAFNTPIGGILYAMEEYKGVLAASSGNVLTTLIVTGSLCSVSLSRIGFKVLHMGSGVLFDADVPNPGKDVKLWMLLSIPFGMACGYYTVWFIRLTLKARKWLKQFHALQSVLISACITTLLASLVYELSYNSIGVGLWVWGDGSKTVTALMKKNWQDHTDSRMAIFLNSALFVICKTVAVAFAVGSGGSGGIFAPILVLGAAFGVMFGSLLSLILEGDGWVHQDHYLLFSVMGMVACFSGLIRLPVTAVVIVFEMVPSVEGTTVVVFPMLASAVVSYFTAVEIIPHDLWDLVMDQDDIDPAILDLSAHAMEMRNEHLHGDPSISLNDIAGGYFDNNGIRNSVGRQSQNELKTTQSSLDQEIAYFDKDGTPVYKDSPNTTPINTTPNSLGLLSPNVVQGRQIGPKSGNSRLSVGGRRRMGARRDLSTNSVMSTSSIMTLKKNQSFTSNHPLYAQAHALMQQQLMEEESKQDPFGMRSSQGGRGSPKGPSMGPTKESLAETLTSGGRVEGPPSMGSFDRNSRANSRQSTGMFAPYQSATRAPSTSQLVLEDVLRRKLCGDPSAAGGGPHRNSTAHASSNSSAGHGRVLGGSQQTGILNLSRVVPGQSPSKERASEHLQHVARNRTCDHIASEVVGDIMENLIRQRHTAENDTKPARRSGIDVDVMAQIRE